MFYRLLQGFRGFDRCARFLGFVSGHVNFNRALSLAGLSCRVVITGFFYEGFRRQAGELPQGFRVQRMFAFAWACDLWAWYVYTLSPDRWTQTVSYFALCHFASLYGLNTLR